ncbi:MAG: ABC transporter permease [Armatimonadetes bacterium]|nr:ABC transporter permease [Armatimonadota bacterium]
MTNRAPRGSKAAKAATSALHTLVEAPEVRAESPTRLAWRKLRRHRLAVSGGAVVLSLYFITIFAEFLAPYSLDYTERSKFLHPPTRIHLLDEDRRPSWPFVYGTLLVDPGLRRYQEDRTERYPLRFFAAGEPYRFAWVIPANIRLFGVEKPGHVFLMGTDQFGRDQFSRILYGGRVSMFIGIYALLLTLPIGVAYGAISGYFGRRVDDVMMRVAEIVMSFPEFYLLLALASVLPPQIPSSQRLMLIILILSFVGWGGLARVIRGMVLVLRELEYVQAAQAAGARVPYLLARHIIPNTASFLIVSASLGVPGAILGESGLSFLGLGIQEPDASWGKLLASANSIQTLTGSPWLLWPGAFIAAAIAGYNLLGDGLRDALDPRSRSGGGFGRSRRRRRA